MNSEIYFRRMTVVLTVKPQRNVNEFHRIERTAAQLSRYGINSSGEQNVFCYLDFCSTQGKKNKFDLHGYKDLAGQSS